MSIVNQASLKARAALRNYLLRTIPPKLSSINANRFASLSAALAGPYTIPNSPGNVIKVGNTIQGSEQSVTLTAGSQTAAQVATSINAVISGFASVDAQNRLVLTSATAPVSGTPSVATLADDGVDAQTGINAAFGWDTRGEQVINSFIPASAYKGVVDGWPESIGELGIGMWVLIEDTREVPRVNIRTDMHHVEVNMGIAWTDPSNIVARNREPIGQCQRAVREVIYEDRTLDGQVYLTEWLSGSISGKDFEWKGSPAFGAAIIKLKVHVYEAHIP